MGRHAEIQYYVMMVSSPYDGVKPTTHAFNILEFFCKEPILEIHCWTTHCKASQTASTAKIICLSEIVCCTVEHFCWCSYYPPFYSTAPIPFKVRHTTTDFYSILLFRHYLPNNKVHYYYYLPRTHAASPPPPSLRYPSLL